MAYLKLKNLKKEYTKNVVAAKNINLEIEKGEFIVFLGPSGCGKTTTMRMIAGLETVTEGDISLEGKSIVDLPVKDRGVAMIFQGYAVWPHMTVYDNIAYALKLRKTPKDKMDKIVKEAADMSDIIGFLDRYPSQLSGGQRQRVAVARAVAAQPKLFLMDEPLSALDAKLRESMRTDLKEIHQKLGATSIFVTHDQSEAMSLADRIVVMKVGEIEQIGTPEEIYNDCNSVFVANFIGTPTTNFLHIKVEEKNDEVFITNKNFKIKIETEISNSLKKYSGKEVKLGFRPETANLGNNGGDFKVTVAVVEPQGSHTILATNYLEGNSKKLFKFITDKHLDISTGS